MILLNPIMLLGMLVVAVPVILHLFNRSRYRAEPFGAMIFLRQAMVVKARKLRLRQVLLLILRCLLLAVLVLALSRPVLRPRSGFAGDQPTTHIIVLDGSLSMTRGEGTANVFHQARQWAEKLVGGMSEKDNAQIIWGAGRAQPLFPQAMFDKVYIKNRLRNLVPLPEAMNFPLALEQAFWAADASRLPRSRIYILTDGQANGWRTEDPLAWERLRHQRELLKTKPFVYVLPLSADTPVRNLSVSSAKPVSPVVDIFRPARFSCEINNHASSRQRTTIRFLVDGVLKAERTETFSPGATEVIFEHAFKTPGAHYLAVETGGDGLSADDRLVQALVVMRRIRVLVLEGSSDENPWKSDGGFFKMALEAGTPTRARNLFEVVVRPQADMDVCNLEYLREFQCVVLADVASVSDFFLFGLERFVEEGGGVLIGLGPGAVPGEYSRIYKDGKGIMPARLTSVRVYDKRYFQPIFPAGAGKGIVDAFDPVRTQVLTDARVARFWDTEPADNTSVIAHFDGSAFLASRSYGAGRTMLWTTTLNPQWNNLALTRDFLPLVQNLVTYLSATVSPPVNVRAGQTLLYNSERPATGDVAKPLDPVPDGQDTVMCQVSLPSGEHRSLQLTQERGEWLGRWSETTEAGLYTFANAYFPTRYFAVSADPSESDLTAMSSAELAAVNRWVPEVLMVRGESELLQEIRRETGAREAWQVLALVVVGLIFLETVIDWRWSR